MPSQEYESVSLNTPVAKVMSVQPVVGNQFHNLSQVMKLFAEYPLHHLPIVDGQGKLIGIVSSNDLPKTFLRLCDTPNKPAMTIDDLDRAVNIVDIMTKDPITIAADNSIGDAAKLFAQNKFASLPVVENGKLVGILSIKDVVANLVDQL
ncbi:MAG: CBS domain-containing protein [Chitinophagales bacterium]|nr:CBS domain-containing protein [Chitinophagales bacterium]